MTKRQLFERGKVHVHSWCALNKVEEPEVVESDDPRTFDTCAYYRDDVITICVNACAAEGHAGRMWSYPGYAVDRTPYGVLAHELGHHVDKAHGTRGGTHSKEIFEALCDPNDVNEAKLTVAAGGDPDFYRTQLEVNAAHVAPISGYADNVLEWFAELFRLFVTNPDLLRVLRPNVYAKMKELWPAHAEERSWERVLAMAPRQMQAAQNKVDAALRAAKRRPAPRMEQGSLT